VPNETIPFDKYTFVCESPFYFPGITIEDYITLTDWLRNTKLTYDELLKIDLSMRPKSTRTREQVFTAFRVP